MVRVIDSVTLAETNSTKTYPIELIKFQVTSDNADSLFLNTGYTSITYNGDTYLPGSNGFFWLCFIGSWLPGPLLFWFDDL